MTAKESTQIRRALEGLLAALDKDDLFHGCTLEVAVAKIVAQRALLDSEEVGASMEEECAACGTALHTTLGEWGQSGDDVEHPFWRFVYGHVATKLNTDDGTMACRECVENGSDFLFTVDCMEEGENNNEGAA
jgi:hypothetical protein